MFRDFVLTQTGLLAIAYLLLFLTAQFKVAFIDKDHGTYTAECHWFRAMLYDNHGNTVCSEVAFSGSCQVLMDRINLKKCGNAPTFVHFGKDLDIYTEQVSINVFELLVTTLFGVGLAWVMLTVRSWRTSIFNVMVLVHLLSSVFAAILFANTRYAMDEMRKVGNNNEDQRVYLGEGFMVAVLLPIALLLHDQFVMDYI